MGGTREHRHLKTSPTIKARQRRTNRPKVWSDKSGNKVIFGDNLEILKTLASDSCRLIYIDPPFNTGRRQVRRTITSKTIDGKESDKNKAYEGFAGKMYQRVETSRLGYEDSYADYLAFLRPRLEQAKRVLTSDGSLFFHIDWREAARCRLLLEDVFGGPEHCINEIIWTYDYGARSKKRWSAKHDNIYWIAMDPHNYVFNFAAVDRIPYMAPGLVTPDKVARGKTTTDTWWHTIVPTNGKEKTGYPTQKPIGIIERIIKVHSEPGDLVLDFFAGSGTLGEAAIKHGRSYILIDDNPVAFKIIRDRMEYCNTQLYEQQDFCHVKSTIDHNGTKRSMNSEEVKKICQFFQISKQLSLEYQQRSKEWKKSPFNWILQQPSRTKGTIGERLVKEWCQQEKFSVTKPSNTEFDLLINKRRVEVKCSTLWAAGGYTFQQIRDQDYEFIFLLGISPHAVHAWIFPKKKIPFDEIKNQHAGKQGKDTWWIHVDPNCPPEWMKEQSGQLVDVCDTFRKYLKK